MPKSLHEQVLAAIQRYLERGGTMSSLAARARMPRSTITRFMAGQTSMTLETADRVLQAARGR